MRIQAVFSLGRLGNRRADATVAPLRDEPNPRMRHGVAFALRGSLAPEAIEALLRLMDDADPLVRDCATTGIGGFEIDGENIRDALLRRCADLFTRQEALTGLALRKDRRVIPFLLAEYDVVSKSFSDTGYLASCVFLDESPSVRDDRSLFGKLEALSSNA